jgi:hypothetical protein
MYGNARLPRGRGEGVETCTRCGNRVACYHQGQPRIIIITIITNSDMKKGTAEAKLKSGNNCR